MKNIKEENEDKLIETLSLLENNILSTRAEILYHKKALEDAESKLIENKLLFEKHVAKLKYVIDRKIPTEKDERQVEIEEFKKRLPEIMKILENNSCQKKN